MQYTSAGVGSYLVQAAGSLTNPSIQSMTADADGNVLYGITAGGSANNFITFTNDNGSTVAGPTNASYYYALAKVSTTGSVSWVNNVFTNTAGQHTPLSAGSDGSGGFYQSGQIQPGTSTFTNAGGGVGATLGGTTKFGGTLAKYDTGGNVLWAARQNQAGGNMSLGSLVVAADRITALGTYVGTIGATIYSAGL
jgi:hypothetical protein